MDNITEFRNHSEIKDQAAAWAIKIHGYCYKSEDSMPDSEREALKAWLGQSEFHRDCFRKMVGSWDAMGMLEELAEISPLPASTAQREASRRSTWTYLSLGFTAAAACAVLIVMLFPLAPQSRVYTTPIGEMASHTLSDGSQMLMNTNSDVHVEFRDNARVVNLRRGEVHFDVAKDNHRPFVVYAGEGMVWAVGTAFNVRYNNDSVDVIVSEGTVKVFSGVSFTDLDSVALNIDHSEDQALPHSETSVAQAQDLQAIVLSAGQKASYQEVITSNEPLGQRAIEDKLAWQTGAIVFKGENLECAIKEISRYTDQHLAIVDASIRDLRVGGRFRTDDIDQLINALARGLNIKAEYADGNQILLSAK